jgi:hypothetical protein
VSCRVSMIILHKQQFLRREPLVKWEQGFEDGGLLRNFSGFPMSQIPEVFKVIDPWNPTKKEIIEWAYNNQPQPEQDWELAVTEVENATLLLTLAADDNCKKRLFFLSCLYLALFFAIVAPV